MPLAKGLIFCQLRSVYFQGGEAKIKETTVKYTFLIEFVEKQRECSNVWRWQSKLRSNASYRESEVTLAKF